MKVGRCAQACIKFCIGLFYLIGLNLEDNLRYFFYLFERNLYNLTMKINFLRQSYFKIIKNLLQTC